jgi:hypothetical protein
MLLPVSIFQFDNEEFGAVVKLYKVLLGRYLVWISKDLRDISGKIVCGYLQTIQITGRIVHLNRSQ